jgi:hypothetical protein
MGRTHEQVQVVNLLDAAKRETVEFEIFADKVSKSKKHLPILVHPFYPPHRGIAKERADVYAQRRNHFISSALAHGFPLTLFEERQKVPELPEKLGPEMNGTVYVIETIPNDPDPAQNSWETVVKSLRLADAKLLTLGGVYLTLQKVDEKKFGVRLLDGIVPLQEAMQTLRGFADEIAGCEGHENVSAYQWIDRELLPVGCVGGAAIELLTRGFNVQFTPVSLDVRSDPKLKKARFRS